MGRGQREGMRGGGGDGLQQKEWGMHSVSGVLGCRPRSMMTSAVEDRRRLQGGMCGELDEGYGKG